MPYPSFHVVCQLLSEPPGAGLQSEEEIGTIAKEARIPVMTNQADDIDDLAGKSRLCLQPSI